MRRTRTRPGGRPARPGQKEQAHAHTHGTRAWRSPTRKGRCWRPHETAPMHRPSPPSNDGRYGKPDASVTNSTHANHRSASSPRPTPERPARDNPIAGPRTGTTRSEPSAPASAGPAAGTMSPVLGRPPRAPRSHPVKPGAQAPGVRKGTTASGKRTGVPRATRPDEARRTTRGHEARQRGTPPATTKAHGQVPGKNGRHVPQTRRARTTRNEPRHRNRCQAAPAAVRMDECAPGGYPAPTGYEQPPSGWTSARPEGTQPLPATNSRRPDIRVSAPQRRPAQQHPMRNPKHSIQSEHTGKQEPSGPGHCTHNTTHRAGTRANRSQGAEDTACATQATGRAQR